MTMGNGKISVGSARSEASRTRSMASSTLRSPNSSNSRGGRLLLELGDLSVEEAIDRVRLASLRADPTLILPLPIVMDDTNLAVTVPQGLSHVFALDGRY